LWDGKEKQNSKNEKTHGLRQNLIGKAKAVYTSKAKQGIQSLLPIGRQVFIHLQETCVLHM